MGTDMGISFDVTIIKVWVQIAAARVYVWI